MRIETLGRLALGWAVLFLAVPVAAAPITYVQTVVATGVLGSLGFTDAPVTITLTSDTSTVSGAPGSLQSNIGAATVEIAGVGTATFTNTIWAFANVSIAGISDVTMDSLIVATVNDPVFHTYDLRTAIGPVTGSAIQNIEIDFPTTAGNFTLHEVVGLASFTAVTAPEPASALLVAVVLAALSSRRGSSCR